MDLGITKEIAVNIVFTGGLFSLLFIAAIKSHEKDPCDAIKVIEALGLVVSLSVSFVFALISIWI